MAAEKRFAIVTNPQPHRGSQRGARRAPHPRQQAHLPGAERAGRAGRTQVHCSSSGRQHLRARLGMKPTRDSHKCRLLPNAPHSFPPVPDRRPCPPPLAVPRPLPPPSAGAPAPRSPVPRRGPEALPAAVLPAREPGLCRVAVAYSSWECLLY